ncbi:MAG: efflux RND transporter periplasmic adaptor subunit [Chlorobium sp.]
MKRNVLLGIVVALLFFTLLFFFSQPSKKVPGKVDLPKRAESPLVMVDSSRTGDLQPKAPAAGESSLVTGVVEPYVDITLGMVVQGRIDKILFSEGRRVPKGAVILMLEKGQEELEVARRKIIWQNVAELNLANITVRTLTESLNSNRSLYSTSRGVSKEELDKLSLQWENAVAERDKLLNQEEREKVEYAMAENALESRILRAPAAGVVEKIYFKAGEICQPNQPVVRLIDSGRCLLTANLDDTRSYHLREGMVVSLLVNVGGTEVKKQGVITKVPLVVDPASGVMAVKVVFENRDGRIKPGVTGKMYLPE